MLYLLYMSPLTFAIQSILFYSLSISRNNPRYPASQSTLCCRLIHVTPRVNIHATMRIKPQWQAAQSTLLCASIQATPRLNPRYSVAQSTLSCKLAHATSRITPSYSTVQSIVPCGYSSVHAVHAIPVMN